jgi:hypothetical protein
MTGVTVTGVGLHPFGRFVGAFTTDLGVLAVRRALAEAGVGKGGSRLPSAAPRTAESPPVTRS